MLRTLLLTVLALVAWAAFVVTGTLEGWCRQPLAPFGDTNAFRAAAIAKIDQEHKGNAAFALLENGRVVATHYVSAGKPVDGDSRFQVASLSKWITAWGVMTLVEAGKLDLDKPASLYLKRWKLPASQFDNNGVTVRRLLSHTAGLTDGLGYAGFKPGAPLQSLEDSLTHAADASPGRDGKVHVGIKPGTEFKYSGGGYTLLQLLIEEVSGQSFNDYVKTAVLNPLGMTRSTFLLDDETDVAEFFDERGQHTTHYRFTALAAASLYTTTSDMTRILQAHLKGVSGEPPGRGVLRPETLTEMRRPHASQYGADIWGLGTILFAPNKAGGFVIGHDGDNAPAINTAARLDPATGDGIVILETGNKRLATKLASEWVFWNVGKVDLLLFLAEFESMLTTLAAGWAAILVAALFFGWRLRR
ncbi:MAG: beta-lactamase family protein [Alphaproteobacteria bacterium]|nr:beta-lactamase family protein [Alphaproteobacteria bacterium]